MNRKRLGIVVLMFTVYVLGTLFLLGQETACAQECRVVSIHGGTGKTEEPFRLNPMVMPVQKGDCVIWINWAKGDEVKVTFKDGKKCVEVTESPVDFTLQSAEQCYVTSWLPLGGTSSLRFKETGTYEYVIESKQSKYKAIGKVVVIP